MERFVTLGSYDIYLHRSDDSRWRFALTHNADLAGRGRTQRFVTDLNAPEQLQGWDRYTGALLVAVYSIQTDQRIRRDHLVTVRSLIETLETYDDDAVVLLRGTHGNWHGIAVETPEQARDPQITIRLPSKQVVFILKTCNGMTEHGRAADMVNL